MLALASVYGTKLLNFREFIKLINYWYSTWNKTNSPAFNCEEVDVKDFVEKKYFINFALSLELEKV